ncbi:MAG: energy-coupling factor transporter transmembrane protein EcfT [Firmicutes bacterium]|nr:energy-coupling factor transporter transmembrane protein EcfT [Bacillota bacterium]
MNLQMVDPRIKILLLLTISSAALIFPHPFSLAALLVLALFILMAGGLKPVQVWVKARGLCGLILMLFLIQCLFNRAGEPLLWLFNMPIVTDFGLNTALLVSLRLLIIVLSAMIVLFGESRDYLLALTQCKVPYEIAFMVLAALRFLPILREEAQDVICAAQLRGLRIKKTGLFHKLKVYISLMLPVVAGAIHRAEQLSFAMEARAFRANSHRSSMRRLRLRVVDVFYALVILMAVIAIAFIPLLTIN